MLFSMSYALLRRFAIIEVGLPPREDFIKILAEKAPTGSADLDQRLRALIDLPHRRLGPAVLIDCGNYIAERLVLPPVPNLKVDPPSVIEEALAAYVVPQLDDLSQPELAISWPTFTGTL